MNTPGARVGLRTLAAAINTAATLTAGFLWPEVPNEILVAWAGVFMAAVGFGEGVWDSLHKPTG